MPPVTSPAGPQPDRKPRAAIRVRTRALLLEAAERLFARRGAGATSLHEIAAEAGVANGTLYNYFRSREDIVAAVVTRLVTRMHDDVARRAAGVLDPAERLAVGCCRFISEADSDRVWGAATLRLWAASDALPTAVDDPMRQDLRAGRRQRRFAFRDEQAAVDLVRGAVLAGMRSVVEGRRGAEHGCAVASLVLRALGVAPDEAETLAQRASSR
jgi:AcrR family transcriptional regulator